MTNRERAEAGYSALARDDLEGFLELVHPDVEFTSLIAEAEGASYNGHDGVREWWANIKSMLGGLTWEVHEIREIGDDGVLIEMTVTGALEGAAIAQTMFQAVEGSGDKVTWWGVFRTEEEALAALGERQ